MKKMLVTIIVIASVLGIYKFLSKSPSGQLTVPDSQADMILFWGDGCPHCVVVEKYIKDNGLDQKVKISRKEVWYNQTNQNLLKETAKNCPEIDTSKGMGVPFAYINSSKTCLVGDQPITDWLNTKK